MTVTLTFSTLLMLIGAVHGFVLSALLLGSRRNRRSSNVLLALMLVCYTLPLLKVTLQDIGFFHAYGLSPWSIELLYGLGPSLYLYSKTVTDSEFRLRLADLIHGVPVLLELAYYSSSLFRQNQHHSFSPVEDTAHLVWMLQQAGAVVSLLAYLALTNYRLWAYSRWVKATCSTLHQRALSWLQIPVLLYTAFSLLWFTLRAIDVFRFSDSLAADFYQPLLGFLALSTYWIGTRGYLESQPVGVGFGNVSRLEAPRGSKGLAGIKPVEKAAQEPSEMDLLVTTFRHLGQVMDCDKPYLQDDLSLAELADQLGINPRLLSKVINTQARMNFYDFVNCYRIEEFKRRVAGPDAANNLLDLAYACGFGSKTTFNHVFKKQAGMTPSRYRKERLREVENRGNLDGTP